MLHEIMLGIHVLGLIVCFYTMYMLAKSNTKERANDMVLTVACNILSLVGYILELMATTEEAMLTAVKVQYLGKGFIGTFLLFTFVRYYKWKFPKLIMKILWLIDIAMYFVILTLEKHMYYYTSVDVHLINGKKFLIVGKAPLYFIFMAYMLGTLLLFSYLCHKNWKIASGREKKILGRLSVVSIVVDVAIIFSISDIAYPYDLVPLIITVFAVVIGMLIYNYGLFTTMDIAKENLIVNVEEGVIVRDMEGNFQYANPKAYELIPEFVNANNVTIEKRLDEIIGNRDGDTVEFNNRIYKIKDRTLYDGKSVAGRIITFFDITDLHENNKKMEQLKIEADNANQAKSEFLAKMSHEIRTPINAVIGMNEMILRESAEPEIHKYAFDIKSAANTLLSIINEILDSSKIESGKLEIIPVAYEISSLFHDVYNMINFRAQKKGIKLVFDIDEKMSSGLYGDDVRLKQIIVNLLTNAVKYTHEGTVTMIAKAEAKGNKVLLNIKVTDTGIGIKEEDLHKLFGKFERIEESRNRNIEGTGLGMNITQQLLKLMGSELKVKSEYGKGSEFSFCIEQGITNYEPLGDFDERINQKANEYNYALSYVAPEAKVLVVDDNEMNRKVFRSLLKKSQINISEADSGQTCIKMLEDEKFDIVFLDYMMPVMDGVETLNIIKSRHLADDVPVIMLTANAVVGAKEQFLSAGFNDYLTKPIAPEKLDKMIMEYLPKDLVVEGEYQEVVVEDNNLPAIDEFDFTYAMSILKDKDILMNTLQDFDKMLRVLPEKITDFYMNIENEEMLNLYKIEVHALKSSAAMVGAMLLSKLARLLEVASIEKDVAKIRVLHPILLEEISKHRDRLLELFPEAKEKIQITDAELLLGYFDMLNMAILDDDYETADFVCEEISKYSYPENICKDIDELIMLVNNLDSDTAIQLIGTIKGKI